MKGSAPLSVETVPIDSPGRLRLNGHRLDFAPRSVWPQSSPATGLLPGYPCPSRSVSLIGVSSNFNLGRSSFSQQDLTE
jgi:hypothetical protein